MFTVVTWNIAWGYGWGSEGQGSKKSKSHFERSLARIGEVLKDAGADIALLQEVDFGSTRSHQIEQTKAIAERAGLPHIAEALSWDMPWVPYPYWPPRDHFGRMRSGGAILSRYPIAAGGAHLFEKPAANSWFYNAFYLSRYLAWAEVQFDANRTPIQVFNTHLEAFDEPNRVAQAERARSILASRLTPFTIFGGDLNTVPPESTMKSAYPDEDAVKTEHTRDRTLPVLRAIPGLLDVLSPVEFRSRERDFFTFPAHAPNRKLDYLFVGNGFEVKETRVLVEAGPVSDHLPLCAKLSLRRE